MITNIVMAVTTAYCSCTLCCGPNAKGITANGHKPKPAYTVAGPRKIKLGTQVIIAGRPYVVEDRLAKRYDSRFDIYFNTHREALQFGIKTQQVTIITP